jgi:hypothetical protein
VSLITGVATSSDDDVLASARCAPGKIAGLRPIARRFLVRHRKGTVAEVLDGATAGGGEGIAEDAIVFDADLVRDVIAKLFAPCASNRQDP